MLLNSFYSSGFRYFCLKWVNVYLFPGPLLWLQTYLNSSGIANDNSIFLSTIRIINLIGIGEPK